MEEMFDESHGLLDSSTSYYQYYQEITAKQLLLSENTLYHSKETRESLQDTLSSRSDAIQKDKDYKCKAIFFDRWKVKTRKKKEEKKKLQRARQHYLSKCFCKYFNLWRLLPLVNNYAAISLYKIHLLKKTFKALQIHIKRRKITIEEEKKKALFCIKRRRNLLKSTFQHWKNQTRFKMLDEKAHSFLLSKEYYKWKEQLQEKQNTSIAHVHFKLNLLSDSIHQWRIFTIEKRVKKRMNEVASIHHEDILLKRVFTTWKDENSRQQRIKYDINLHILRLSFQRWKKTTVLQKITHQQEHQTSKEFYHFNICKRIMKTWRHKHLQQLAVSFHEKQQKRRSFKLWYLQMMRRKLMRRLARAHCRKVFQKHAFSKWKIMHEQKETKRITFIQNLNNIFLRSYFTQLKIYHLSQKQTRLKKLHIEALCFRNILSNVFISWKSQYRVKCFVQERKQNHSRRISEKYYQRWKNKVKKKRLQQLLPLWNTKQDHIISLGCFMLWKREILLHQKEKQRLLCVQQILDRRNLARHFFNWRIISQEDILIKPLVKHRSYVLIARCFDAWKDYSKRQVFIADHLREKQLSICKTYFQKWRSDTNTILNERQLIFENQQLSLQKYVNVWTDFVHVSKQRRENLLTCYAARWLDYTQQSVLNREIKKAEKVSNAICTRVCFTKWLHRYQTHHHTRHLREQQAEDFFEKKTLQKCLARWKRCHDVRRIVSTYLEEKQHNLLSQVFLAWYTHIQDEIKASIQAFHQNVTGGSINDGASFNGGESMNGSIISSNTGSIKERPTYYKRCSDSAFFDGSANDGGQNETAELISEETTQTFPLDDFTYDSDFEIDLNWAAETSIDESHTHDLTADLVSSNDDNLASYHEVNSDVDSSTSRKESINTVQQNPMAWTDVWKERLNTSQEKAILRRHSHHFTSTSFPPPISCSTARINGRRASEIPRSSQRKISVNNKNRKSSMMTFTADHEISFGTQIVSVAPPLPEKPDILTRRLPFAKRTSSEEMNSGKRIFRMASFDESFGFNNKVDDNINCSLTTGLPYYIQEEDCQSFTSARSDGANKQLLLVGTLHHWKSIGVSHAFYAWYRYSKRMKYIRDMHDFLIEKKYVYLTHKMFLMWNRRLYCLNVSQDFPRKQHLVRSMKHLQQNVFLQKQKRERTQQYQQFHRTQTLKATFTLWKKKLHMTQKVSNMLVIWRQSTRTQTVHKDQKENFTESKNNKTLKSYFITWVNETNNMILARHHYNETLTARCLNVWWQYIMIKEKQKKKIQQYQLDHQIAKAFLFWKRKHFCVQQVKYAQQDKEYGSLRQVFLVWHGWTQGKLHEKRKIIAFHKQTSSKLVVNAFDDWKTSYEQTKTAQQFHQDTTVAKCFYYWSEFVHQRHCDVKKTLKFQDISSLRLLLRSFKFWKTMYHAHEKHKINTKLCEDTILKHSFHEWRKMTRNQKLDRFTEKRLIRPLFSQWKEEWVAKKKRTLLMKAAVSKWKRFIQKSHRNQTQLNIHLETKDMILISEYFTTWEKQFKHMKLSLKHRNNVLLKRCVGIWIIYTKTIKSNKQSLQLFHERRSKYLEKRTSGNVNEWLMINEKFKCFLFYQSGRMKFYERRNYKKYDRYLWRSLGKGTSQDVDVKIQNLLHCSIKQIASYWRLYTKACIYSRERSMKLQRNCFSQWKDKIETKQMCYKRNAYLSRKYFYIWYEKLTVQKLIGSMYHQKVVGKYWIRWRRELIRNKITEKMKQQDERMLLSQVFLSWLKYVRTKRTTIKEHSRNQTSIWFYKWKEQYFLRTNF